MQGDAPSRSSNHAVKKKKNVTRRMNLHFDASGYTVDLGRKRSYIHSYLTDYSPIFFVRFCNAIYAYFPKGRKHGRNQKCAYILETGRTKLGCCKPRKHPAAPTRLWCAQTRPQRLQVDGLRGQPKTEPSERRPKGAKAERRTRNDAQRTGLRHVPAVGCVSLPRQDLAPFQGLRHTFTGDTETK